jgi:peptide deformylase|tara:strand:+ start:180 stop:788 length:609 start_codon:yes stop_codon:yes gene_type:complete
MNKKAKDIEMDFTAIGEKIKQLDTSGKGLEASGFEIEETDIKLVMNDDYLWDELPLFDFNNPPIDPEKLSMAMVSFMRDKGGVGLAANQVGYNFKMFVTEGEPAFAVFNPTITFRSPNEVMLDEGCLSFPNLLLKIKRPSSIRVRFQDPYGNWITKQFAGMSARVFLHENDHLLGVDFTDKVSKLKLDMAQKKLKKRKALEK